MKPTKARSRSYVDTLRNSMEKEIREKKTRAIRAHIESEWLEIDSEFRKLRGCFESLKIRQNVKDELADLLEENSLEIWSLYRDTDARDSETYKRGFLEKFKCNSMKGLTKIETVYDQEIRGVGETYNAIVANVERVLVKQGVVYLEELGFNADVFKEEEARLLMIAANKSKLRLPSETADSKWKH